MPLLVGVLVIALAFGMMGGGSGATAKKGTAMQFPTANKKKKSGEIEYLPEDEKAQFASISGELPNAFKPAVQKRIAVGSAKTSNAIPPIFTSGETGWIYTGNMEVNGGQNALLENGGTGEGVFLKPGEKWKSMTLKQVKADSIVLRAADGFEKEIFFGSNQSDAAQTVAPVNPGPAPRLAGQIGGGGQVFAESPQNMATLPAIEGFGGNDQTNGRRGRRNQ
ncbi:MAG: hypothetical protein WCK51_07435 [Armatimonadota bacterium]